LSIKGKPRKAVLQSVVKLKQAALRLMELIFHWEKIADLHQNQRR